MTDVDYSKLSVNSINCDKCAKYTSNTGDVCSNNSDCLWIPQNTETGGKCVNNCGARLTKGQCGQYHEWNRSKLTPKVYDFSGNDNLCEWHPHAHSIDGTVDSKEGDCRPTYFSNDINSSNSSCFDKCDDGICNDGECINFKEGRFCIPNDLETLGNVQCGFNYNGHHVGCNMLNSNECSITNCEKYIDERKHSDSDTGICVSDGAVRYDLDTGEELGLIMTDEQCGEISESGGCMNYRGYGCLWEPFNEYCIPNVPQGGETIDSTSGSVTINDMFEACKPIEGHVPHNYDINMLEEEHINVSEFRDRDNIKYPYITSKYVCDVCHIRDNDLDNMKELSSGTEEDRNNLKYYMIKKFVDFVDGNTNRTSTVGITPQEYCENEIDDNHEIFNPCVWDTSTENSSSPKGGKCISKCAEHTPVDSITTNSQELKYHKEQCISDKWYPDNSVRGIEFPNIIRGSEADDDYFKDRYCTWDGFECHNSIPCKFAQQTRCEDLGYEWYEGTALDIMNQPNNDSLSLGIPIDLSTSYPIVRKGDGKPVEGDMEGVCIYPNTEAGFISTPTGGYMINPEFIGNQVIMIKWREYGSGWWEDMSCKRKMKGLSRSDIEADNNNKSYLLGENVALIPFRINQGDRCDDIKIAINNALQNHQYFVYNGEWVVHAEDIIHAIDRSYESSINEEDLSTDQDIANYQKHYGYMYYSNIESFDQLLDTTEIKCTEQVRRHLNAIYDLRGAINILPVLNQHCVLEITNFSIDSNTGNMNLVVKTNDDNFDVTKFEFIEFIGTEIFKGGNNAISNEILNSKLNLTVLSKYNYISNPLPGDQTVQINHLPNNIVQGYGTLYENIRVKNIEKSDLHMLNVINQHGNVINDMIDNKFLDISDNFYSGDRVAQIDTLIVEIRQELVNIGGSDDIIDKVRIMNNIISELLNVRLDTIIGGDATLITNKNSLISGISNIDTQTGVIPIIKEYDIRNIDGFNTLKNLLNLFRPESGEIEQIIYDPPISGQVNTKKSIDYWAPYVEFNNFNVFSQPIIKIKDELNKAKYIPDLSSPNQKKLCSGSLESYKIQHEGTILTPVYQTIDLNAVSGLLKMMAGYLDDGTEINTDIITGDLIQYKDSYQQTDITKSVIWSITRNTPPFWGNLVYNKQNIDEAADIDLYGSSGNFNIITNPDDDVQVYGKRDFNYNIGGNTLFKPFCEAEYSEDNQKILWKNIMSYTGGNKREIQLSRNVSNGNYDNYIDYLIGNNNISDAQLTNYKYTNGTITNRLAIDRVDLNTKLDNLLPIINESKKEYVVRSLLDWKRLNYKETLPADRPDGCAWRPEQIKNENGPVDNFIVQHLSGGNGLISNDYLTVGINDINTILKEPNPSSFRSGNYGGLYTQPGSVPSPKDGRQLTRSYCDWSDKTSHWTHGGGAGSGLGGWLNLGADNSSIINSDGSLNNNTLPTIDGIYSAYYGWKSYGDPRSDMRSEAEGSSTDDDIGFNNPSMGGFIVYEDNCNYCDATYYLSDRWCASVGGQEWEEDNETQGINSLYDWISLSGGGDSYELANRGRLPGGDTADNINSDVNTCCGVKVWPDCDAVPENSLNQDHIFAITPTSYTIDNVEDTVDNYFDTTKSTVNRNSILNKLSHIDGNDIDGEAGLVNWIYNQSGVLPSRNYNFRGESELWSSLSENVNITNKLYYPLEELNDSYPTSDGGGNLLARNDSDNLRSWCMSNSSSVTDNIDPSNMLIKSAGYSTFDDINPDNPEKNSGILYNNWLNNDNDLNTYDNTEIFGKDWDNINAYKYPEICEPWLLKASHDKTKPAHYSDPLYWEHWNTYNPFDDAVVYRDDYWKINGNGVITQDAIDMTTLQTDTSNSLHNMLFPLSITSARPREKNIYIDITPNNDIFNKTDNTPINTYYFTQPTLGTGQSNLYQYDLPNNDANIHLFWLRPGIGSTNSVHKLIIGKNTDNTVNFNGTITDVSNLEYIANHHVAYFKAINELFRSDFITCSSGQVTMRSIDDNNNIYKFNDGIFDIILDNMRENNNITSTFYNQLDFTNYYLSYLPPKGLNTIGITNELFGTGFSTVINNEGITNELQIGIIPVLQENTRYILPPPSVPAVKYFNINMVFPRSSITEEIAQTNICKDLVKSKLTLCGNHNNWPGNSCENCFEVGNATNLGLCSLYDQYIVGNTGVPSEPGDDTEDEYYAQRVGVCGILENNLVNKLPWDFIDVTKEPESFGSHLPTSSPYDIENRNCNNLQGVSSLDFLTLEHSGLDNVDSRQLDNVNFFKPARSSSSDIFEDSHSSLDNTAFGCMRKDLSLMKSENIKLSCNTTLKTPVERDKHAIINFIIKHDPTGSLNSSERTKLAIMSEEELLNKALDLGININYINEYTRPKIQTKVRDTKINYICEDGITPCHGGTDAECPENYRCGLYEEWNDLQKYYYNIKGSHEKEDFTSRKEWNYIGCGIDLNYSDNSSGEAICKDKYPGLCQQNIEKCNSENVSIREAIHLDCPETCKIQFNSIDQFKQGKSGPLSICTSRGRCKWSHDMDPANLLPLCEENTSRELGSSEKCRNYNSFTDGPETGSCNLKLHPETINSTICAEQRCTSMQGCVFTPQESRICTVRGSVDERVVNEVDCPEGGRWIGSSIGGQCILPERNYYDSDLQDFEQDCNILGGRISVGTDQSCEYKPDIPYTGEDPCSHIIDLDDLTYDEQLQYFYQTTGNKIYIHEIVPEKLNDDNDAHPKYIKIKLNMRLNDATINNYRELLNMTEYPKNKYIYIDNDSENSSLCSQYLLGKSKIVKIDNFGEGDTTQFTEIIVGGPSKAYMLPLDTETGKIDIGGENACEFRGLYDLEGYTHSDERDTDLDPNLVKANACYNNGKGACNYEFHSENCVSCGMYKDEVSCFGNNDPNEYSHCGWGSIKDMCGVIGEMDECVKMHMDGCEWDPATQKCSLNKLTDDDGNPLVDKVGCVKCDDMLHKNTCNSMKNCFWDALTTTDDGVGQCRACSSIRPDENDGIDFGVTSGDGLADNAIIDSKCDNFQLTKGQCEFRNPINKDTGLENLLSGETSIVSELERLTTGLFDTLSLDLSDDEVGDVEESECEINPDTCKCSPTRKYPIFPDWIIHNLMFLLIFTPFAIYFMIAWYNVLISPSKLVSSTGNNISTKYSNAKSKISNVKDSFKGLFKNKEQSGGGVDVDGFIKGLEGLIKSSNKSWLSKQKDKISNFKIDFSIFNTIFEYFDTTVLHLPDGSKITTDWVDLNVKGDFTKTFSGMLNPEFNNGKAQFAEMIPKSDTNFKIISIATFLKFGFLILSLPFTIIQYLSRNIRLAPFTRIGFLLFGLGDSLKTLNFGPVPFGLLLWLLCIIIGVLVIVGGSSYLFLAGFKVLKQIIEVGLIPNHNYVDPIDGITHRIDGKTYPAAAYWPKQLYREEWDDMIKDPVSEAVIEQRENMLPGALQGDINNEDNVSDVYKMAYLEIEPESLNWTTWFRDAGKTYNKFINRIGDNFIFTFIISPYLLYKYITTIKNYLPIGGNSSLDIKSFVIYTVIYSIIFGLLSVYMSKDEVVDGEYDGVETKCYGDIESPFKLGNEPIHYPKLCSGDSYDDSMNECPYGCYYVGSGNTNTDGTTNLDYGKKCKDNRSALSLGKILKINSLEPEPKLNIPFDEVGAIPSNWNMVTPEEGISYVCPPTSRFMPAYPYDKLCYPTAKRCKSSSNKKDHNDICEMLYMKNNYDDEKCNSKFMDLGDLYTSDEMIKSARGEWYMTDWNTGGRYGFNCELETPYLNYKKDNWCPFPLPAAENEFFSDETDTRDSISLWEYAYDKIRNPGNVSSCSYDCNDSTCSSEEYDYIDICRDVKLTNGFNKSMCEETTLPNGGNCTYYPENVPLQTRSQNQERYLIVNQEYGGNLFN